MTTVQMTDVLLPIPKDWDVQKTGGEFNELIRKTKFADRLGVDRSLITQRVKNETISGEALIGEGRTQKLRFGPAYIQFEQNRDALQAMINGKDLSAAPAVGETMGDLLGNATEKSEEFVPPVNSDKAQYEKARLFSLQLDVKRKAEDDQARNGSYMATEGAAQIFLRAINQTVNGIEADFHHWSTQLAAEFGGDPRLIKIALKKLFRETRESQVRLMIDMQKELPEFVEDVISDDSDSHSSQSGAFGSTTAGSSSNTRTAH